MRDKASVDAEDLAPDTDLGTGTDAEDRGNRETDSER